MDVPSKAEWDEVGRLVEEQKLQAALDVLGGLRERAEAAGDAPSWRRGLVQEVQLRSALHGYETAVRLLKSERWPDDRESRVVLNLFYAHSLVNYLSAYSWEIGQREGISSTDEVDLRAWTSGQIIAVAEEAYLEVFRQRQWLGGRPVADLAEYLEPNTYPPGIRDTLRDAVSYLLVELLADSAWWSPEQSNEIFALDLSGLMDEDPATDVEVLLGDQRAHPVSKLAAVLADLERWHAGRGELEAALEARLELTRRLSAVFTDDRDRTAIRDDLAGRLPSLRQLPWWAMGQSLLAELWQRSSGSDDLVRAHGTAEQGWRAYPDSVGGKRCLNLVKRLELPELRLEGMAADGPGRRSLAVWHKNAERVYLRAYPVDLLERLSTSKDYNLLPAHREVQHLLSAATPVVSWSAELPATPDLRAHRTYVTPRIEAPGLYVIVASLKASFAGADNLMVAANLIITDLVLLTRPGVAAGYEATVLEGDSGLPAAGVEVLLFRFDWRRGHRQVARFTTDGSGTALIPATGGEPGHRYVLVARRGSDAIMGSNSFGFGDDRTEEGVQESLVYTDRSVYRPLQKLLWKVVAYSGDPRRTSLEVAPGALLTVSLVDANGENVASQVVTTNDFGSAAGEFSIPAGRLLGEWRVECSRDGTAVVRVEEYKRPTFEVEVKEGETGLRINRPATFRGEAQYYFGLPVTSGRVAWRVTREPVVPWWWAWYGWGSGGSARPQVVASGETGLDADGAFSVVFTPAADERLAGGEEDVSYRFRLSADVTDEGGETRSASRAFRLGFVAVEAVIQPDAGFLRPDRATGVSVTRTNLDGSPRAGEGSWRLLRLEQPESTLLPAELPVPDRREDRLQTPGDRQRPRWAPEYRPEGVLRSWPDGEVLAQGSLTHGENGQGTVDLPPLEPGAYRLRYETRDDFGALCEASRELLVVGRDVPVRLFAVLAVEHDTVRVSETARFLVHSGLPGQVLVFELFSDGRLLERRRVVAGRDPSLVEVPVTEAHRGGFAVRLWTLADYQLVRLEERVVVPYSDRELAVEIGTFRDTIRPGGRESWRITVRDPAGEPVEARAAELLAYMYDRSLDIFAPHHPPSVLALYPSRTVLSWLSASLGQSSMVWGDRTLSALPDYPRLEDDRLVFYDAYGVGGPGHRMFKGRAMAESMQMMAAPRAAVADAAMDESSEAAAMVAEEPPPAPLEPAAEQPATVRSDFAETAFWRPQLLTGADGSVTIEFQVPDSVTAWNVWVHALTRDLRGASLERQTRSVKELMVRPYLPRFLREGDSAELKVVVNNASDRELAGSLRFEILDPASEESLNGVFGLRGEDAAVRPFRVAAGGGTNLVFPVTVPPRVGTVAFRVTAAADGLSDGELRALPVLPGRMHLMQSRFVTLRDDDRRTMTFEDLARDDDPSRIEEALVVTVDAQLFYSALAALPYLVNYPYECTEQILNRFVSTGILTSLFDAYPAVGRMAAEMAKRETRLETFDAIDPNRKMELEETPWLTEARGGDDGGHELAKVLDPRVARSERQAALGKLTKAQTASGGFPWWPGGPPSPFMTVYVMYGLAKAAEFGVEVPREMVEQGWAYLAAHFREEYVGKLTSEDCCWELLTFINYVATCYPDPSWMGDALTEAERLQILEHSFKHWKEHSPYLKGFLALTLARMGRPVDARLVFDSVMDSARTTRDEGTFWAPEERGWLWYNDTIETHAFALRTLAELAPADPRKDGMVQWLLLNKKLNHWQSTRATAEVLYSLAHVLASEGALANREQITVTTSGQRTSFTFEPDRYTGKRNQVVVPGEKIDPATSSTVTVEKSGKGLAFASATWQFSTERLPEEARGDLFAVSRRYFRREVRGSEAVLTPLAEGAELRPGDEIEVQLSLSARHPAEYVHLRDPRPAGCEPVSLNSEFKWGLGIGWYEEVRDSGSNFFFEWLPQGEYPFSYRLRANVAGAFKVAPAVVQSMYAPEFTAYSAGAVVTIAGDVAQTQHP